MAVSTCLWFWRFNSKSSRFCITEELTNSKVTEFPFFKVVTTDSGESGGYSSYCLKCSSNFIFGCDQTRCSVTGHRDCTVTIFIWRRNASTRYTVDHIRITKSSLIQSKLRRTLLGGLTFLTVKGVIKIYHKQHVFVRQGQRKIMDYNEMPSSSSAAGVASSTQTNQNGPRRQWT